jgi:hypothetical protein
VVAELGRSAIKNMSNSFTSPIRDCKRLEQHAIFKELKRSSGSVRKVNLLQNFLKPVGYFLFLFHLGIPLTEHIGHIGFVLLFVAFSMLYDELIWRFLVIPALAKELQIQAEQAAPSNR